MWKPESRTVLRNLCATSASQLSFNISCNSQHHRDSAHYCITHHPRAGEQHYTSIYWYTYWLMFTPQLSDTASPDVYCYLASILLVWIALTSSLFEDIVQKHPRLPLRMSCFTVFGLVLIGIVKGCIISLEFPHVEHFCRYNWASLPLVW